MNERIAKLYDQAIVIEDGGDYVCGELDIEKFAELIMQESREWVGLTDDEIYKITFTLEGEHWRKITDAIEAKLKEKNT